jgi:hypothetical protein
LLMPVFITREKAQNAVKHVIASEAVNNGRITQIKLQWSVQSHGWYVYPILIVCNNRSRAQFVRTISAAIMYICILLICTILVVQSAPPNTQDKQNNGHKQGMPSDKGNPIICYSKYLLFRDNPACWQLPSWQVFISAGWQHASWESCQLVHIWLFDLISNKKKTIRYINSHDVS